MENKAEKSKKLATKNYRTRRVIAKMKTTAAILREEGVYDSIEEEGSRNDKEINLAMKIMNAKRGNIQTIRNILWPIVTIIGLILSYFAISG